MSLGGTKALVLVLMTVLTIGVSLLPLIVRKMALKYLQQRRTQLVMSGCLCFGGGVLLATVFLHLLPEVRHYMDLATQQGFLPHVPYPLSELLVCIGFFFIYVCEEVVHTCVHQHSHQQHKQHQHHEAGINTHQHDTDDDDDDNVPSYKQDNVKMNIPVGEALRERRGSSSSSNNEAQVEFLPTKKDNRQMNGGDTKEGNVGTDNEALSMMRSLVMVAALSIHSIMEGLALGLVHSNRDVWVLFGALSAHKLIIAFCMAMELLENGASRLSFILSMLIFSLASPVGGVIGTLVVSIMTETTAAGVLVPTILQGLSAGTILYVTFCEVLERERAKQNIGYVRMWTFLLGFVFMAGMQVLDSMVEEESVVSESQYGVTLGPEHLTSVLPPPPPPLPTQPW
ncbi:hypothetical protein Pmani_011634 [Petrolisthes manimaculis]|uniref:Uncharacterized protein n=1 Tax=Petrolisthes manimaculis TaxID=1843537 RepID=A0AAE1Q0Q2_9EUCA|nr:hypothetical protein Pmani_011634 [Petrolisthes manimaculis]